MTYRPVLPPYAHQKKALAKAGGREAFAYLMAMRTGKTKVVLDEWGALVDAGECRDLLVQAPAGAYLTWLDEIEKHVPPAIREKTIVGVWQSSGGSTRRRQLERVIASTDPRRPRIMLVNVEALGVVEEARDAAFYFLRPRRGYHAVDESTTIKNVSTKWTFNTHALAQLSPYRRIMTGLVAPRDPLDLYSQFEFLDHNILGFRDYGAFEAHFTIKRNIKVGKRYVKITVANKNLEELNPLIEPHSFRVRLEDCADVPKKVYLFRDVVLTPEQERAYAELKKFATTRLESGAFISAPQVVVQMLRLHQICCGHVVDEEGNHHEISSRRHLDLSDLLEEYDGKAIVWCSYDWDVRKVSAHLRKTFGKDSVAQFWGGNRKDREDESRRFKTDDRCRYMVATPDAGGRGRTWDEADLLVYYSNRDNLEHRDQSEERASSTRKTRPVTVVDMRARGTVEDKIIQSLREKMTMAQVIHGDNWREWLI